MASFWIWSARLYCTIPYPHTPIPAPHLTQPSQGRAFALQEAHMAIATIFQRFDLVMDDPSYQLKVKQSVTVKPEGFHIRAYPRNRKTRLYTTPSSAKLLRGTARHRPSISVSADVASGPPLYVLYGSNSGTSEGFAQRVASDAPTHGFRPSIGTLDSAAEKIPSDGPVVIITASFEGQFCYSSWVIARKVNRRSGEPADNAAYFVKWLSNLQGEPLSNLRYAVFGCGNRDWVQTYQRIPRLVDELLGERGGHALLPRGEGDAGGSEMFNDFDSWEARLFEKLTKVVSLHIWSIWKLIFPPPRNTTPNPPRALRVLRSRRHRLAPLGRRRFVRKMPFLVE